MPDIFAHHHKPSQAHILRELKELNFFVPSKNEHKRSSLTKLSKDIFFNSRKNYHVFQNCAA